MKVLEARRKTAEWLEKHASNIDGYCGAMFGGSSNFMDPNEELPIGSDIDLWMLVAEQSQCLPQKKIDGGGFVIEACYHLFDHSSVPEEVLHNSYIAPHFSCDCVISDPTGKLAAVNEYVKLRFRDPDTILSRLDGVFRNGRRYFVRATDDNTDIIGKSLGYLLGIKNLASQFAVAGLGAPPVRKCLVVSRHFCEERRRLDIHDKILDTFGFRNLTRDHVQSALVETEAAFERAIQVIKSSFWGDFNIEEDARSIVIDGSRALIETGYHKEAMFFVLLNCHFCHMAIRNDAPQEERSGWLSRFRDVFSIVGAGTVESMRDRGKTGMQILEETNEWLKTQCCHEQTDYTM